MAAGWEARRPSQAGSLTSDGERARLGRSPARLARDEVGMTNPKRSDNLLLHMQQKVALPLKS